MSLTVRIPAQLRTLTGGVGEVQVEGATVGEALKALDAAHPGFAERIFDERAACAASSTCSSTRRTSASSTASARPSPLGRRCRSSRRSPGADPRHRLRARPCVGGPEVVSY